MTNEITKANKNLLDSLNKINKQTLSLRDKLNIMQKLSNKVLLCDTSRSMSEFVNNEARRIDILNSVLENFKGARLFEFNSTCNEVTKLDTPRGGTALDLAFETVKDKGIKEVILLTDGEPNSQVRALESSIGLKVNIIYIGNPPVPDFLKQLAKQSGGIFDVVELIGQASINQLESKIRLALNA